MSTTVARMPRFIQGPASGGVDQPNPGRRFVALFVLLACVYTLWLAALWPGILGEDSAAIMLEIDRAGEFLSGKPAFWFFFVNTFYGSTRLAEVPIAIQLVIAALVFARILSWCWQRQHVKTFWFLLLFIALSPRAIYSASMLYPDGPFAIASISLLFELWLTLRARRLSTVSFGMIAVTLPFALSARANGIVLLIPLLYTLVRLQGWQRLRLGALALAWCTLLIAGATTHRSASHGVLFPLTVFETVNFMQPHPMQLWRPKPRVSAPTLEALHRYASTEVLLKNYDRDYWDSLYHKPDGPRLGRMSKEDKRTVIKEFFRYNLWQNVPAFVASRVNVFLVSALAEGDEPSMTYSQHVIPRTDSQSTYRAIDVPRLTSFVERLHDASFPYRWLLWTPLLGIALLLWLFFSAAHRRQWDEFMLALPMIIQLGAIFLLSIAGEYRYLLPFFMLPLAILPILLARKYPLPSPAQ